MMKRLMTALAVWMGFASMAHADVWNNGDLYIGPMFGYQVLSSHQVGFKGGLTQLNLGMRSLIDNRVVIAGEVFAGYTAVTIRKNTVDDKSFKNTWNYGASILPGIQLDSVIMGFLRLGVAGISFKDFDARRWGVQGGGGLDVSISSAWNFRGECDYTIYKKVAGYKARGPIYLIGLTYNVGCGSGGYC